MPSYIGPNTSGEENLVFAYDLDNRDNSYKGRPAMNLVPDAATMTNWSSYSAGNNGTFITEFGTVGYQVRRKDTWNGLHKAITLPATGTYTISAWFRIWDKTSGNNGINVYTNGGGIGDTAQGGDDTRIGEWQKISMTRTYTTTSITFFIISWGGTRGTDWSSWDVTMPQIEAGSESSSFVDGTRTATDSLLDITGNNIIDISNVSFDSNQQITFDGTDDYINAGISDVWNFGENGTLEMMVKPENSTGNNRLWCIDNNSNNLDAYLNSSGYNVYMHGGLVGTTTPLTQNQWNHLTVTYSGGTIQIYINGVAGTMTGTTTGYNITNPSSNNSNLYIGCYRNLGYNLQGDVGLFKIYNRGLTAEEVNQNFRSVKSRFNIA